MTDTPSNLPKLSHLEITILAEFRVSRSLAQLHEKMHLRFQTVGRFRFAWSVLKLLSRGYITLQQDEEKRKCLQLTLKGYVQLLCIYAFYRTLENETSSEEAKSDVSERADCTYA